MNAVELGHSLNMLPCYVGGNPKATFKWYTGGNLVNAEETLTRGNSGMYTAVAVNRLGRVEIPVKVDVQCKSSNYLPSFNVNILTVM